MEINVNHPAIFALVGTIIAVVIAEAVFFLVKALKRAKKIGMDKAVLKKTIISAAIFTIAPAVAILVGVITLSKSLGTALPWLRLSVIGSLSYETIAAEAALREMGLAFSDKITDASQYITVTWVMTIGIILGLILVPVLAKKIQNGMRSIEKRDKRWGNIFSNAMFLGMISAFLGYVFCDVTKAFSGDFSGFIPVLVMFTSLAVMAVLGILSAKLKQKWILEYALPISLLAGMASAIPYTAWLG